MHIHLITYAQDKVDERASYMIVPILHQFNQMGHKVTISRGIPAEPVAADLAIMHVDLTVVPPEYVEFGRSYPKCINIAADDISKRKVSGALLAGDSEWDGRVVVKTNLNCCGIPEIRAGIVDRAPNQSVDPARTVQFAIYGSLRAVPPAVRADPAFVIERFLPEREDSLFAVRFWTFSGDQERCARVSSADPFVKSANQVRFEFCDVPDQLRARRKELGFDFGKFDFVIHDGEPVLLDANKTPGMPPLSKESVWPLEYAEGLLGLAP